MFIFIASCVTLILCVLGGFFDGLVRPIRFKRVQGKPFDGAVSLHLTEKPEGDKKRNPYPRWRPARQTPRLCFASSRSSEARISHWIPYLALGIFPLLAFLPFNWVEFSWGFHHRPDPMPPEVSQRADRVGRYVLWLRHGLAVAIVLGLAVNQSLQFSQIGLRLDGWLRNCLIGIVAALLPLGLQGFYRSLYPLPDTRDKALAAEPTANWIFSQLVSVLGEDLWLALCVVSLLRTGHSNVVAVLLPATVFGVLHFQYRAGAIGTGIYGAISASLFLWRGSLLPSYFFHYAMNMGSFYWARHASRKTDSMTG
jgi:hypothetical protein